MASTYEKMTGGELYCCSDESLMRLQAECLEKQYDYNATRPSQREERERLLREMFAEIGEGAIVMPGVSIGDNTVIGAGSVVTKDIPANVVVVGNPCRVLREIGERDREFYFKDRRIDWDEIARNEQK